MQMRPDIQITSVIKAMTDVVIPAIDPANKLAVEQSQLIIGLLSLLKVQLPVQFRFDRDELSRLCTSAAALSQIASTDANTQAVLDQLATDSSTAARALDQFQRDPAELIQLIRTLRQGMSSVVDAAAASTDTQAQLHAEKLILSMSKEQLLRDRSLVKMQSWEMTPADIPAIDELLGQPG